jgi:hypothetical protein
MAEEVNKFTLIGIPFEKIQKIFLRR